MIINYTTALRGTEKISGIKKLPEDRQLNVLYRLICFKPAHCYQLLLQSFFS
jgi:hypothetical protein